jgi:uncharacterized membrane protein
LDRVDAQLGVPIARVVMPCAAASVVACLLVLMEVVFAERTRQGYLVGNLALAWIPLGFAWLAWRIAGRQGCRSLAFWGYAAGWLLFLPNCPYLFTDVVHALRQMHLYWPDTIKILLFAMIGMITGAVSIQLVHGLVARRFGWLSGWGFVMVISMLCAVGVALGRFRRWNSWDALHQPHSILKDAVALAGTPSVNDRNGWFFVLLSVLIFSTYAMIHALRHTPALGTEGPALPSPGSPPVMEPRGDPAPGPDSSHGEAGSRSP